MGNIKQISGNIRKRKLCYKTAIIRIEKSWEI